jgi:hypothetical protein
MYLCFFVEMNQIALNNGRTSVRRPITRGREIQTKCYSAHLIHPLLHALIWSFAFWETAALLEVGFLTIVIGIVSRLSGSWTMIFDWGNDKIITEKN